MALPAGRYGVTKEQLRKIKRLPINTIGMITETKEGIAIVEDGAKASQLITAGRQFWHNGKLYSADVDIAKDADIVTSGEGKNATEMPNITDQLPGLDAQKADNSVIAPVENQPTCQKSEGYAVGEHFIRGGKFCTVTQAISSGDTLTENTNYTSGDVADKIEASFKLIRALTSADDLNDIFTPGIYEISSSTPSNTPEGVNTCMLEVFIRGAGSGFYQRVSITTSSTSTIYQRAFTGSPGSWKSWFKFEGTIVS